jgi:uncharacterized low-complexity protein
VGFVTRTIREERAAWLGTAARGSTGGKRGKQRGKGKRRGTKMGEGHRGIHSAKSIAG